VKPIRQAAPRPVLRTSDQACGQSIAFDVSARAYDVRGFLEGLGFEPPLVDGPLSNGAAMMVIADGMGNRYPMHQPRQARWVRWTHDQMPVVRENAVGKQPNRMPFQARLEHRQKGPVVVWAQEDRRLADAAIDNVEEVTSERAPKTSGHTMASTA
jgi:hypothetical protein